LDFETILRDPDLAETFFRAGYFYADFDNDAGTTSRPLHKLGFTEEEMRSGDYRDCIHPEDLSTYRGLWNRVQDGWEDELYCEYRLSDRAGKWHWIQTHAVVVERSSGGEIRKIIGTDREITSRKNAEEYLHRQLYGQQQRYEVAESLRRVTTLVASEAELSDSLSDGAAQLRTIVRFDRCDVYALVDEEPKCLLVHPEPGAATPGTAGPPVLVEELLVQLRSTVYPLIEDDIGENWAYGSRLGIPLRVDDRMVGFVVLWHRQKGFYRGADLYPVTAFGDILAVAIHNHQFFSRTVTELETDELTGFRTRRSFDRDAGDLWAGFCERYDANSVAMIDIDHFKWINDRDGHPVGDAVIRTIARLVQDNLRKEDVLGRYGGDEFIALLPNSAGASAWNTMERLRAACEAEDISELGDTVTISVGIAFSDGSIDLSQLVSQADEALYRAKREGRNGVVVY
jgi:diguanylate cyclase (GGDEF)-like protein/PAS domain S-box-containing protein